MTVPTVSASVPPPGSKSIARSNRPDQEKRNDSDHLFFHRKHFLVGNLPLQGDKIIMVGRSIPPSIPCRPALPDMD
jgi:hypothetical protein